MPVGGVTSKIEAAAEIGIKKVLIPYENMMDVLIEDKYKGKIEIVAVRDLNDVLSVALVGQKKSGLLNKLAAAISMAKPPIPEVPIIEMPVTG